MDVTDFNYVTADPRINSGQYAMVEATPKYAIDQVLTDQLITPHVMLLADSARKYVEATAKSIPSTAAELVKAISPVVLPSQAVTTAMHEIMYRVRPLAALKDGWDGYEGVPPTRTAIEDAEQFAIHHLYAFEKAIPAISPASDGEINFYWENEAGLLDLGFYGDGSYSYFAKLAEGRELIEDSADISRQLPAEILAVICHS